MMGGFERVRQASQEDVYCNGARHVWLYGEQFGLSPAASYDNPNPPARIQFGACDCHKHRSRPERVPA